MADWFGRLRQQYEKRMDDHPGRILGYPKSHWMVATEAVQTLTVELKYLALRQRVYLLQYVPDSRRIYSHPPLQSQGNRLAACDTAMREMRLWLGLRDLGSCERGRGTSRDCASVFGLRSSTSCDLGRDWANSIL